MTPLNAARTSTSSLKDITYLTYLAQVQRIHHTPLESTMGPLQWRPLHLSTVINRPLRALSTSLQPHLRDRTSEIGSSGDSTILSLISRLRGATADRTTPPGSSASPMNMHSLKNPRITSYVPFFKLCRSQSTRMNRPTSALSSSAPLFSASQTISLITFSCLVRPSRDVVL